ncbi:MAG TPA: LTA synthase family protein, partial [Anaerovoracaceae bacterium]|nr:LTA synthase family protein [Anaerovoracaceae bacterium]
GEAFSTLALNETTTPTLCRLSEEGFVFNNFYNPIWNVSTSDGEYVTLTGLIPKSGIWSFKRSAKNYMPYGFGNLLKPLGYTCKAYHNHYYSYYSRDESHPNLGYEYKGLGNGLKITETWPESDLEMLEITATKDIVNAPFHTYYMTVSGHLNYTFYGNYIAKKHKGKVEHLQYSEPCLAYLACNIDLDLAVSYLIDQLTAAGQLENTVIVLSGDHYPYGLTDDEIDELAGYEIEKKFEKFRSTLIIWSGDMSEPIEIDKVCSSLDIMPTLANLFGLKFDSRLIVGQDILSESPGLVELNDRSWITDLGRYDASKNRFIPNPGVDLGDEYARNILNRVNKSFEYSAKILENDYYRKVSKIIADFS